MSVDIKKIGVIGAGQMGGGIAQVCAAGGFDVYLIDQTDEAVSTGLARMTANMDRDVSRGRLSEEDRDSILSKIVTGTSYEGFADCDIYDYEEFLSKRRSLMAQKIRLITKGFKATNSGFRFY